MNKPKILIVGSLGMDFTFSTNVFPNEGETIIGTSFKTAPGGKGANQAVQVARLGADTTMVGKLGKDANGEELLRTIDEAGIHREKLLFDEEVPTQVADIILEEAEGKDTKNRIIIIQGANMTIRPEEVEFLKEDVKNYDMVILQLEIPMEINEIVAKYAYDAGVPVMLNSAPSAPLSDELLSHLTYISPNEHEAKDITGVEIRYEGDEVNMDDVRKACEVLREKGVKNALITLGGSGAALLNDDGFFHYPCVKGLNVVDPTAAGDSFVGAFCTAVCLGFDMEKVLCFANHVAALTVCGFGAMPSLPTLDRVIDLMKEKGVEVPDLSALQ
ncbi:MAG: ribokinase [Erysipelotrichaceae bacterium]|nr:ribokinase [Erysipelotrichaceae bacterium]MBR5754797.1 ribokinase [Erysipelotrichaceae bacterium]